MMDAAIVDGRSLKAGPCPLPTSLARTVMEDSLHACLSKLGALAHEVHALAKYKGLPLADACPAARALRDNELAGDKGMVAVEPAGYIVLESNSNFMHRAWCVRNGKPVVARWKDD